MIISFSNTPLVLACVCALLIAASHVLAAFMGRRITRWTTPLGAALHAVLAVLLFFAGAELDLFVLFILASVFVYSLLSLVSYKFGKKGESDR